MNGITYGHGDHLGSTSLTTGGVQVMVEEEAHYLAIQGSGTLTGTGVVGTPGIDFTKEAKKAAGADTPTDSAVPWFTRTKGI